MTDVKQELPDGWELTPLGHALRAAMIAGAERDAAIKRAEEAATKLEKENESWRTVAALTDENEKLRESRDAAIKRAEEAEQNAELRSAQLSMVAGEITGDSKLHWLNDRGDPRWTPSLQEAWALRQKVKECAAQIVDALKEVSALRAENEKLRGELAEANARAEAEKKARMEAEDCEDEWHSFARQLEDRIGRGNAIHQREQAAIAQKTAREQIAACADFARWGGGPAGLGDQERWAQFIRGTPLVTDAPSKPGAADCEGCAKVWRHHHRGERGTVCARHNYGPSGDSSLRDPAPPPPESPAEPRLRPCDSPGCGGHHE